MTADLSVQVAAMEAELASVIADYFKVRVQNRVMRQALEEIAKLGPTRDDDECYCEIAQAALGLAK